MADCCQFYAHTPPAGGSEWHCLRRHLVDTAKLARSFASDFQSGEIAYWLGLWHDLGKFDPAFQEYLRAAYQGRRLSRVPHARWGAVLAYVLLQARNLPWEEIGIPILGHHAGLADAGQAQLKLNSFAKDPLLEAIRQHASSLPGPKVSLPNLSRTQRELLIRMLSSALVDADYLDTERHFEPSRMAKRGVGLDVIALWERFEISQGRMMEDLRQPDSPVNSVRREVYEACLLKASGPGGVYKLTVPTGGGKTRSGLAFALKHAVEHGLHRVIIAIPYTSIVDQTAQVYREILGEVAVIEHHSLAPVSDDENQSEAAIRLRLATENWDGPLVVTTTVQLFESLLGRKPSKLRKLHNLARSVIVLDEVQTIPPGLLTPTLDVLRRLVEDYDVTVVLSTATQPALDNTPVVTAFAGFDVHEIVDAYPKHFRRLRRVHYERKEEVVSWGSLGQEVGRRRSALVILNARRDALDLLAAMPKRTAGLFHLSTLLCGAHRRDVLRKVAERLQNRLPVHLISTQVVEAGVDLDFPVVYRALGPLDRIIQAAGRCNREGRRRRGNVIVFEPEDGTVPRGEYKLGTEKTGVILWGNPIKKLHDPAIYREYFSELYGDLDLDARRIQDFRQELNYPRVAELYRLIPEETTAVVVPYGDAQARLAEWRRSPSRTTWQRLQPFVVNLLNREAERLEKDGWLEALGDELFWWRGTYDSVRGAAEAIYDPADLYV